MHLFLFVSSSVVVTLGIILSNLLSTPSPCLCLSMLEQSNKMLFGSFDLIYMFSVFTAKFVLEVAVGSSCLFVFLLLLLLYLSLAGSVSLRASTVALKLVLELVVFVVVFCVIDDECVVA